VKRGRRRDERGRERRREGGKGGEREGKEERGRERRREGGKGGEREGTKERRMNALAFEERSDASGKVSIPGDSFTIRGDLKY